MPVFLLNKRFFLPVPQSLFTYDVARYTHKKDKKQAISMKNARFLNETSHIKDRSPQEKSAR
jgi:hypothetical protein